MNRKQWEHLAKVLSETANIALTGLTVDQVLSSSPFHPYVFIAGILACCGFHLGAIYCLKGRHHA
jgi:hypothetical protein